MFPSPPPLFFIILIEAITPETQTWILTNISIHCLQSNTTLIGGFVSEGNEKNIFNILQDLKYR